MAMERPTTIEGPNPGEFEDLLRELLEMNTSAGYKAEIIGGKIVVSPWQRPYYKRALKLLQQRLAPHVPAGHDASVGPFLFAFPAAKRAFGPDLHVADEAAFEQTRGAVAGAALSLVAEMTSESTRDADWEDKLAVYGRNVPVYLLVDMQTQEITAFWRPSPNGYRARRTVSFGEALPIPEPFGFELDTTGFEPPGFETE
ncbi:Uma2 family endonuclease [Streptomyces litchfieldiae]|uniref:Uma2 family endonuclease n=1 Tax=Streptomyces litchfieldiae TaxID=3075543 RepID=A0ABU2MUH8_9ACTN|nr:Uma2 family endonuclease [Streptomyces sp. DSM 44938]MDT0345210.1 Uma2 family endonuclease [Streptomyces sp. DSM 44938]